MLAQRYANAMALRALPCALPRRALATAAEKLEKSATKGPKLPPGNDPSASHGHALAAADASKWRYVSVVFAIPVLGFGIVQSMKEHEHIEAPPEYPYLKMATRVPRFPWGDDDLIGTSFDRRAKEEAIAKAKAEAEAEGSH